MARRAAYLVFLMPVVISLPISAYVLSDIVQQPGRELNMWPDIELYSIASPAPEIDFVGIAPAYSVNDPLDIQAKIRDEQFDCGDVYITVYDSNDRAVAQNTFFEQCFSNNRSIVPTDEKFSILIDKAGKYRIVLEMLDKAHKHVKSASTVVDVT